MVVPKRSGPRRDVGLFGPGSITWEVFGDTGILALSGARSAILSLLFSEVADATYNSGKTMKAGTQRYQETLYWGVDTVFGDTEDARRAGKFVDGMHAKVGGLDPVTGAEYHPYRKDLAVAGFCVIWEGPLIAYEIYVRALTSEEREEYWREGLAAAAQLDLGTAMPATYKQWRDIYEQEFAPRLNYSHKAELMMTWFRRGGMSPNLWGRPFAAAAFWLFEQLVHETLSPDETAMLARRHSALRSKLTRLLGRPIVKLLSTPSLRNSFERSAGGHVHEIMEEARELAGQHQAPIRTAA